MPEIIPDGSSPIINALIAAGGFLVAIIGGVIVKVRDSRKEKPAETGIVAIAGGIDSRTVSHPTDQIAEVGRSIRDLARALHDNERATLRLHDLEEDRARREQAAENRMLSSFEKLKDKP